MERDVHRITVDDMEFGRVLRFGRVLKAMRTSLQREPIGGSPCSLSP